MYDEIMEQHPVPQQISSYQFRLVGDMTLKQFFQVAAGAVISVIIYSSNLYPLIKWPLMVISFALGVALAFLPLEDRPLSQWILSFFKSVYAPTIFEWEQAKQPYQFFTPDVVASVPVDPKVENYLKTTPDQKADFAQRLNNKEETLMQKVTNMVGGVLPHTQPKAEGLKPNADQSAESKPLVTNPTKPPFSIPVIQPIKVTPVSARPRMVVEETVDKLIPEMQMKQTVGTVINQPVTSASPAKFSTEAAPPYFASIPNTITGQVLDQNGKIISGAILEIKDSAGRPVRALRSNPLGHFQIVTALPDGKYDIVVEKEGFNFKPISFETKGEIIPPIAIKAIGEMPNLSN